LRLALAAAKATASADQSVARTLAPSSAAAMLGSPRPQPSSSTREPAGWSLAVARASTIALGQSWAQ
jgi:hypothetical protein